MDQESMDQNAYEIGRKVEKYDKYKVVRGLVSLTPKEEVTLLLVWFIGIPATMLIFIGLVAGLSNTWVLDSTIKFLAIGLGGVGIIFGGIAIQKLLSLKEKIFRGWSTLFFLNTDWIFASPNRNSLFGAFLMFLMAFISGIFGYIAVLGGVPVSPISSVLLAVVFSILCGLALRTVWRKA